MKTLVILSHPNHKNSRVTQALVQAPSEVESVTVRNIDKLYGTDFTAIDVEAEKVAHEAADRIVYMFPIHWFNLTPMLKAYMNAVWQYSWAFGEGGYALAGKEMQVIAGAAEETYTHGSLIQYTTAEILAPIEASSYYTSMTYNHPIVFTNSNAVSDEGLKEWQQIVKAHLESPLGSNVKGVSLRKKLE
ncbi:NAD(P)H-dependent oxidoreductase [Avibacterium sp. 20-126]|uniref:NAD(P)H-dependent oxidoreductase n=1 Tax=Avibacterium sp. 20-126 TaxID=2911524 RepID=UPI00218611C5|nr:NAD(P)H-dependent oxidoreductase [Avibacterium sp. 20-126]